MYEADVKGGRPSIAPEKLMWAMLLQVLYSVRSERQIVEQIQFNLLFRWFVGLTNEDAVWNQSVFSKNHDRLIEHAAVTELFNATVEMANKRGLLSGEHFSVDGTLTQAWASYKSMRRKDRLDDCRPPEDWRGEPRSNDKHESTTPNRRLNRSEGCVPTYALRRGAPNGGARVRVRLAASAQRDQDGECPLRVAACRSDRRSRCPEAVINIGDAPMQPFAFGRPGQLLSLDSRGRATTV